MVARIACDFQKSHETSRGCMECVLRRARASAFHSSEGKMDDPTVFLAACGVVTYQARRLGGFGGFVRTPPWQAEVRKLMLKSANNGAAHWACYNDNHGLPACHLIPQFRSSARLLMQPQTLSRKISLSNSKEGALWTSEIRQKAPASPSSPAANQAL